MYSDYRRRGGISICKPKKALLATHCYTQRQLEETLRSFFLTPTRGRTIIITQFFSQKSLGPSPSGCDKSDGLAGVDRRVLFSATTEKDFDVAGSKSCYVWCSVNSKVLDDPLKIFFLKQSLAGSDSDPSRCVCGYAVVLCCNGVKILNRFGEIGDNMQW